MTGKDLTEQLSDITDYPLFVSDPKNDPNEALLRQNAALSALLGAVMARKEEIDAVLRSRAEAVPNRTDKTVLKGYPGSATLAMRVNKAPDPSKVLELVEAAGVDPHKVLDPSTVYTLNPSRVRALIDSGSLSEDIFERATKKIEVFTVRIFKNTKEEFQNTLPARLRKDFEDDQ